MATFTPPIGVSFGTSVDKIYRTMDNDFGDGYSQTTPDGLNNVLEVWSLVFESLTDAQADEIEGFLDDNAGIAFSWETPRGQTKRFVSAAPKRTFKAYNNNGLTVSFTEKPGVI